MARPLTLRLTAPPSPMSPPMTLRPVRALPSSRPFSLHRPSRQALITRCQASQRKGSTHTSRTSTLHTAPVQCPPFEAGAIALAAGAFAYKATGDQLFTLGTVVITSMMPAIVSMILNTTENQEVEDKKTIVRLIEIDGSEQIKKIQYTLRGEVKEVQKNQLQGAQAGDSLGLGIFKLLNPGQQVATPTRLYLANLKDVIRYTPGDVWDMPVVGGHIAKADDRFPTEEVLLRKGGFFPADQVCFAFDVFIVKQL